MASNEVIDEDDTKWIVDSGCTSHMCKNESMFTYLNKALKDKVRLGNGKFEDAEGKGTISINTHLGTQYITNVVFVPTLKQNLLSVNQMTNNGYKVLFESKCCRIYHPEWKQVETAPKINQNYLLRMKRPAHMAQKAWTLSYVWLKEVAN